MQQSNQQEGSQAQIPNTAFAYQSPIERYGSQIQTLTNPDDDLYKFELYLRHLRVDSNGNLSKIGNSKKVNFTHYFKHDSSLVLIDRENKNKLEIEDNEEIKNIIDKQGIVIEIKEWYPMLNEQGINDIVMAMKSVLNSMTPLSNLEDWEIAVLIRTLCYDMVDLLTFKSKEYEVNDIDRKVIVGSALRFCYIFLKRPYEEGDRKFFTKITQEVKHTSEIKTNKEGKFSLNPLNWLKGGG